VTTSGTLEAGTYEVCVSGLLRNPSVLWASVHGFEVHSQYGTRVIDNSVSTASNTDVTGDMYTQLTSQADYSQGATLDVSPTTAGSKAAYTFSFYTPVSLTSSNQVWIIFPDTYDYFVTDVVEEFPGEVDKDYFPL